MAWSRISLIQAYLEDKNQLPEVAQQLGYDYEPHNQNIHDSNDTAESFNQQGNNRGLKDGSDNKPKSQKPVNVSQSSKKLPDSVFIRIKSIKDLDPDPEKEPVKFQNQHLDLNDEGTFQLENPLPLFPESAILPSLFHCLGSSKKSRRIDHDVLVRRAAHLKTFGKMPKRQQMRWPSELHIIVSMTPELRPYWVDFECIIDSLKTLLGEHAVHSVCLVENTLLRKKVKYTPWQETKTNKSPYWQWPQAHDSVLILGDLGVTAYDMGLSGCVTQRERWKKFLLNLQQSCPNVWTLSPAIHSLKVPKSAQFNQYLPYHDGQSSLSKSPVFQFDGQIPTEIVQEIFAFFSVLPWVDLALLRVLRQRMKWGDSRLESYIWNHDVIDFIGIGICLSLDHVDKYHKIYRERLAGSLQEQLFWEVVDVHFQKAYGDVKQLIQLTKQIMLGSNASTDIDKTLTKQYFQDLIDRSTQATAADEDRLLRQCSTVLSFLGNAIWFDEAFRDIAHNLFGLTNKEALLRGEWPEQLPPNFDKSKLKWLLGDDALSSHWHLIQKNRFGEVQIVDKLPEHNPDVKRILSLETLNQAPITELNSAEDDSLNKELSAGSQIHFDAKNTVKSFRSLNQDFEIEAFSRPSWAESVGRDEEGLFASVIWNNRILRVPWQQVDNEYQWVLPQPLSLDQFGLYTDINLKGVVQRMRYIPPGEFKMGDDRWSDSQPVHRVKITKGFWLADTVVTQELWEVVMKRGARDLLTWSRSLKKNPSHFKGEQLPVECVSWSDAQLFISRVLQQCAIEFRLPTEAEWEYACRAGTQTRYFFGDDISHDQAHFSKADDGDAKTTIPVKNKEANAWGLYQMHGNVWEWCQDRYDGKYYASSPERDPSGPSDESINYRVLRGGGWDFIAEYLASGRRYNGGDPDYGWYIDRGLTGFRVALGQ